MQGPPNSAAGSKTSVYMSGAEPTLKQTAEFFGVSISLVISSRSFTSLVGEFPMFRRVTLNFSIISRNVRRIRKWLDTASKDDK